MNSSIYIFDKNGKTVKNKKVSISFSGLLSGGMAHGFTDGAGCANITHSSKGTAKIFVNGNHVTSFSAPGSASVTI